MGGLERKLWAPKVVEVPSLGISGLPLGSLRTKCHLDVALVEKHKVYYKGEGDGFPQVRVVVSFVCCANTYRYTTYIVDIPYSHTHINM